MVAAPDNSAKSELTPVLIDARLTNLQGALRETKTPAGLRRVLILLQAALA